MNLAWKIAIFKEKLKVTKWIEKILRKGEKRFMIISYPKVRMSRLENDSYNDKTY